MKKTLTNKVIWLIVSILVSISLPAGILMIILGFGLKGFLWMGILGIVLVVHGFYGVTFYWMQFGKVSKYHRIVKMIEKQHYYTAGEIAEATHIGRDFVNRTIRTAIERDWITGYKFDGNNLTLNENVPLKKEKTATRDFVCSYCGAKILNLSAGTLKCPNCGAKLENEDGLKEKKQ